ncbi:hypothetical protein JX265_004020 [Neoarthrinium moseri]|uniref:AAA+ ATPase domain-containing protein n=1 Tax=Neoarthrinium moseri TaxID=1658444 RepID=A0A9P9WRK2_9PEZI|nr:hypothetical protein JX265_004020 [Neoarthrinium moseri]
MASREKVKVYRLQGIPADVKSHDDVLERIYRGRDYLADYDIKICSLASAIIPMSTKVATLMQMGQRSTAKRRKITSTESTTTSTPDHFLAAFSRVKDGLVLDDHFLGWTPLNDVALDDWEYDCIAISGIGSHPFGSWQPHGGDKDFMWIRDALPKSHPYARTLLYGYDTELRNTISFQRVHDISTTLVNQLRALYRSSGSKRSTVFLSHSLGGIVLKQALIYLSQSTDAIESSILETTLGGIFFGVPNHGMSISHLIALAIGRPNHFLIDQLKENAPYLQRLEQQFESVSRRGEKLNQKIFFWGYETKESLIPIKNPADGTWSARVPGAPRLKLVERESATRGLWRIPERRHFTFQIDEDHSSMVKFIGIHDPNLTNVQNILGQIFDLPLQEVRGLQPEHTSNPISRSNSGFREGKSTFEISELGHVEECPPFRLPSESPNFPPMEPLLGRGSELESISTLLNPAQTGKQVISIHGPPGIGKSQLVTRYARLNRDAFTNVFYLDGQTNEQFRVSLRREINRIGETWSAFLLRFLSAGKTHAANIEHFCAFLNKDGNGSSLLVIDHIKEFSLVADLFQRLNQGFIVLVSSSSQIGAGYPSVKLGAMTPDASIQLLVDNIPGRNLTVDAEHRQFLVYLDHHPGLIRAAAPSLWIYKSLTAFKKQWAHGKIRLPAQFTTDITSIFTLEYGSKGPGSEANDLLSLCTLFDSRALTYEFLEFIEVPNLSQFFMSIIPRLVVHGLVEMRSDHQSVGFSLSEILRQYVLQKPESNPRLIGTAMKLLAEKAPRSSKDGYSNAIDLLAPHAERFAQHLMSMPVAPFIDKEALNNLERIASVLRLKGSSKTTLQLYGYVHHKNRDVPGQRAGKSELTRMHAKDLSQQITPEMFQLSPRRTAELYNNMGLCSLLDGGIKFAQSCFTKGLNVLVACDLCDSPTILEVVANLAWTHIEMEQLESLEPLLRLLVNGFEGGDSQALLSLGPIQHLHGRYTKRQNAEMNAKPWWTSEDIVENHQDALLALEHAFGFGLVRLEEPEAGLQILEHCHKIASTMPRTSKRLIFSIIHDMATANVLLKRWDKAIALYEKARDGRRRHHGSQHNYTVETTAALANTFALNDQPEEARVAFQEALNWQRENLRPNHPATLQTLQNYGIFQHKAKDLEVAAKALKLAYEGLSDSDNENGTFSWKRVNAGVSLALVLQDMKNFDEASNLFQEAVRWHEQHPGKSCPRMAYQYIKTLYRQGVMYEAWSAVGQVSHAKQALYCYQFAITESASIDSNYWKQLATRGVERLTDSGRLSKDDLGQIGSNVTQ